MSHSPTDSAQTTVPPVTRRSSMAAGRQDSATLRYTGPIAATSRFAQIYPGAQGTPTKALAAGHGPYHQEWLAAGGDRAGQRRVWRLVRQVLLTPEEPHERTPLVRLLIAHRAAQHRIL